MISSRAFSTLALVSLLGVGLAVAKSTTRSNPKGTGPTDARPDEVRTVVDQGFLSSGHWDDGKAELSVYDLNVTWQLPSGPLNQRLRPLTILVKHDLEIEGFTKPQPSPHGSGVTSQETLAAFQWQSLYDVGNNRRSRLVSVRREDLRPLEQSYGSVSWEGNCYLHWKFPLNRRDRFRQLCFSGPSKDLALELPRGGFTALQMPLLIRALDFSRTRHHELEILGGESQLLTAEVTRLGVEGLELHGHGRKAEKIQVRYSEAPEYPGAILGAVTPVEIYWRGTEEHRPLLRMNGQAETLSYEMSLVEEFRSAWWDEDVRPRLRKLGEVPGVRPPSGRP